MKGKTKKIIAALAALAMTAQLGFVIPASAEGEPAPAASPVATAEASPVATVEASPVATAEASPVATTEASPVATVEATAEPTPEPTAVPEGISYSNNKVTVKNDAAHADLTSATLIYATYDATTNAMTKIKAYPLTFTDGVATKAVYKPVNGSKFFVWDSLSGMKPIYDALVVTNGVEVTPAPTADPEATGTPSGDATEYYKLDFENSSKTYLNIDEDGKTKDGTTTSEEVWASEFYAAGMSLEKDSNNNTYFKYNNNMTARKGPRAAYLILPAAAGTTENDMAVAEFDFSFNSANSLKQIVLVGNSSKPVQNEAYKGNAAILNIIQPGTGEFTLNNSTDEAATSQGYTANTWAHAKAVMNFEAKTVVVTVTSLDGEKTFIEETLVPMESGATKLSQLDAQAHSSPSGIVCMDNLVVRSVLKSDLGDVYHTATFNVDGKETILSAKEGETLTELPDTTKTGYIFDGWAIGGDKNTLFTNEDILDIELYEDLTIEAVYHRNPEYIEPMAKLEFSQFPANGIPTAGADENTAADNPIEVKIVGEIGGNLTEHPDERVTDLDVKWEFLGFKHIASKAMAGENPATADGGENKYCDSYAEVVNGTKPTDVNFKLKSQAFNFYGVVKATVTYNGETMTISKEMAILPDKTTESNVILPKAGYKYVQNANNYSDDLVGFQLTTSADNKAATDLVSGDWAAYGGNTGRGLYIQKDAGTQKKLFKLKSTGTNSSTFAVNKLDKAPTGQVIIAQDVKFYNTGTSILFKQDNPVTWGANSTALSFNFTGTGFNINDSETITAATAGVWYHVVIAADVTSKLCNAAVYDMEGNLLGKSETMPFTNAGATAPVYLCYRTPDASQGEMDFNNVTMYVPEIDATKFTVTSQDETLSIPKAGAADVTTTLNASALSTEGYEMIGNATWEIDSSVSDTANLSVTPDATNSHIATFTVKAGAPSGEIPINVTIGGVKKTVTVNLTSSQDSIQFTKSTASISIPLESGVSGEYEYAAKVVGPTSETDDTPMDITDKTVTLTAYDKTNTNPLTTMPTGITFNAETGKLTVTSAASATTLYIRATSTNRKNENITKAVKVTIHGLAFDFGAGTDDDLAEGYTAVTPTTAYSDTTGYGIESGTPTAGGTADLADATKDNLTGNFTFKAKVTPAKNYKVTVNYLGTAVSEKVNADLSGVILPEQKTQGSAEYVIPVIDDVLDLSFSGGNVASIIIEKMEDKAKNLKPHIYTIGDSTIANNGSWAYVMNRDFGSYTNLPDIATFSNNGRGGKNLSSYYTGGEFRDRVLSNICPDDYVMIGDMGTNGMGSTFEDDFNYYVDACEKMGAKIILNSYSPHGAVGEYASTYNSETHTFDTYRKDAYDVIVRKIYAERTDSTNEKYDAKVVGFVDIGRMADAAFNAYTADFAANGYADANAAAQAIISCFSDHNHYSNDPLAAQLMILGYGTGADAKGIVKSLYEIISADLATATE